MENQNEMNIQNVENEENVNLLIHIDDFKNINAEKTKEHLYWIDCLRILASFLVILVHSSFYALYGIQIFSKNWAYSRLWDSLGRSCVPLFIMISGALFLDPEKNIDIPKMYKKYIYRIGKILIFWNFIYVTICKFAIDGIGVKYTWDKELIFKIYEEMFMGKYHLWYLYMCIGLYILTPIYRAICKERVLMKYFILISLVFTQFIPNVFSLIKFFFTNRYIETIGKLVRKLNLSMVGGYSCHFILGYYLNSHQFRNKRELTIIWVVGILCQIFTYSMKLILSKKNNKEIGEFDGYTKINVTLTSIAIFLFFKYPVKKVLTNIIQNNFFKSLLLKLSSLTFGVYQVHVCYLELFQHLKIRYYDKNQFFLIPLHATLVWIISAITIYIMKRTPYLKEFV